jgi:hypothetical protein
MATKKECSTFWEKKLLNEGILSLPSPYRDKIKDPITLKKMTDAEAEYSRECGMYDPKQIECIQINTRLENLLSNQGASALSLYGDARNLYESSGAIAETRKDFNNKNCTKIIEQYRQQELGDVASKFSALDKARIEEESKYVRNQRVFFGGLVLLGGIVIISMFSKKK